MNQINELRCEIPKILALDDEEILRQIAESKNLELLGELEMAIEAGKHWWNTNESNIKRVVCNEKILVALEKTEDMTDVAVILGEALLPEYPLLVAARIAVLIAKKPLRQFCDYKSEEL